MRRPPDPSDDDMAVWHHTVKDSKRLTHNQHVVHKAPTKISPRPQDDLFPLTHVLSRPATPLKRHVVALDARLDLHGLTVTHAHQRVIAFLHQARAHNWRHIEIITGRGDPTRGGGVLRREVPLWLDVPPWRQYITAITDHHGAYRIMLRRNKA